jgi:hypothetical protein
METSKAATADREESPLGIELPAAGAPYLAERVYSASGAIYLQIVGVIS